MTLSQLTRSLAVLLLTAALAASCANPGKPDGGPYDETPPRVVGTSPKEYAINNKQNKIKIVFDEYIRLENAADKIVISPPQLEQPEIRSSGKNIYVTLRDTLIPNTTYTIDFSDAIKDNNEGNAMGSYAFVFSTGTAIDTMEVSGKVLNAENLEPVKGILVGLHSDLSDSAFTTKPLEKIGRTDGSGRFVIKGVAPGKYRIYALNDVENDYTFRQKSEAIAFTKDIVVPSFEPATREDTVWADSTHIDSITTVHYTHFMPDDIVLRSFTEVQTVHHLLKTERKTPYNFSVYFTAPTKELPVIKGLNFNSDNAFILQNSTGNDTVTYWLRSMDLVAQDTLTMTITYTDTNDSTGIDSLVTDTLDVVARTPYSRIKKDFDDKMETWIKRRDRAHKRNRRFNERQPRQWIHMRYKAVTHLAPNENIHINLNEPISRIDTSRLHLMLIEDSVPHPRDLVISRDSGTLLSYTIYGEWRSAQKYKLVIDSAAFTSIYGNNNIKMEMNFDIPATNTYASLFVTLSNYDNGQAYVQLLNADHPIATAKADGDHADFFYITPGKYYLRMFVDENGNGKWDTGLYSSERQPEPVYYYPDSVVLKSSWDTELPWDVRSTPIAKQKPLAITRQKGDIKRTATNRNAERAKRKQKEEQKRQRNKL